MYLFISGKRRKEHIARDTIPFYCAVGGIIGQERAAKLSDRLQ